MELVYFVNLIFIFVVNILFFFSGICLSSLVIVSFWRSVQLRKKLCYFTIMILSCCDLLVVLTSHPSTALTAMCQRVDRAETKALIGGGGCIFIYSRSARRISFEISCHYR